MLIYSNVEKWANINPKKVCLIHCNTRLTYLELVQRFSSVAHSLAALVGKGGKIIIRHPDPLTQLVYLLGASKAGIVSILADVSMPGEYIQNLMNSISPDLYIDENHSLCPAKPGPLPEISEDDIFLGALSSGSTGTPKLILRDHGSWVRAFPFQSSIFKLGGGDRLYLAGPLTFTANLNSCLHLLHEGGTVVFAGNKQPGSWLKEIKLHTISSIFMVPANYRVFLKVLEKPVPQIQSLVSGGAKLDSDTVKGLIKTFPDASICEYYGASELSYVSFATAGDLLKQPGSVGKAFPGVKLWTENRLVWVESPYIAPAFRPRGTTGDMGWIDDEGYLFLKGRENNMINSGGIKIIPEQVEEVINRCPGVAASVVKGIDDSLAGQRAAAWVVKSDPRLVPQQIRAFCRKYLPVHHCPRQIFFIEELPLNINGKVDRNKLNA